MKKTGIMGGTFNPIHFGHLAIAQKAWKQFTLDKVLFLPCGVPYMKDLKEVLPAKIRCEMTRLAIEDIPFFELSMIEAQKETNTYTCETIAALKKNDSETEYYFIVGADSLWDIEKWKSPDYIFQNCHILAARRDDKSQTDMEKQITYLKGKFGADISLLEVDPMDISSSMIRNRVRNNLSIHDLVPETVETYIYSHKLYQCPISDRRNDHER